jgi:predicted ABC-type ATPase
MSRAPRVVVIAGPNGAGKTTVAPSLLSTLFDVKTYVNADTIAQGLAGFDPESASLAAGRVMLVRLRELARQRADFAFETTLASRSFAPFIRSLNGYQSMLLFLYLRTPELAAERVFERVQAGGHHVPAEVVKRRYEAGLRNLFKLYLPIVDHWFVWDASLISQAQLVATGRRGAKLEVNSPLWQQLEETYGT